MMKLVPRINNICEYINQHTKNSWGLYVPITKANIVRNNELLREEYIFEPSDESIFIARRTSINNQAGDKLYRYVIYTKNKGRSRTYNKCIIKRMKDYVRNYAYQYGNNILDIRQIPLLVKNENRKNYELF